MATPCDGGRRPLAIAVFSTSWGEPSETFVRREVDAAIASGNAVVVVSLRPPVSHSRATGVDVVHFGAAEMMWFSLASLVRHPARVLRHLVHVVRWSARRNLIRHLGAWLYGIAAARRVGPVDVAHAHFAWLAATSADAFASVREVPLSVFPHAFDVFEDDKVDGYLASKLERAALIAVESSTMSAQLAGRYDCSPEVVRIGVPAEWVRPAARPPMTDRPTRLVSVGMLRSKKGHDVLLHALAECPGIRAVIVGEGSERSALESLVRDLGLQDRVELPGLRSPEEVRTMLDDAHIFCLASRKSATGDQDGVPNVLIEALARSVPCISTELSGIPDLLCAGRGILVRPEDPHALSQAIARFTDDPAAAAECGARGWAHVKEHYVADANWQRLESLLRAAVAQR